MKHTVISKVFYLIIAFIFSLQFSIVAAQSIPSDINSLSDSQLIAYWEQAKSQGYTLEQLKVVAQLKGVSSDQIAQLEARIANLGSNPKGLEGKQINNQLEVSNEASVGFVNNSKGSSSQSDPVFGLDFFNNPNISFAPNLNVATPDSYQLGPGDELVLNIWGAAENTYNVQIDREGVLRLPNIGPVFVNGMDISEAKQVILNKLKKVYGGISASDASPYKVFVNISLSKIRSIQVNIIGEVTVPGTYTLSSVSTILTGLYAAGGPTRSGTFRQVKLVREGESPVYFDIYKYLIDGSQEGNITLRDNDLIIISPYLSRVTVNGAVKRPGKFELKPTEKFSDLLKFASGFTAMAYKDKFSLQRIDGDRLAIKEIYYENILNENLENGDVIEVTSIIDQIENSVTIEGPVYRPGTFEFKSGLTINDLIKKASGVTDAVYLDRAVIYRGDSSSSKIIIPFRLSDIIDGKTNIVLENKDRVELFGKGFLNTNKRITISGGVANAGSFDYFDGLTIEDLILFAGGLTDGANPSIIDVYRKIKDDDFETLSESFKTSIVGGELDFSNTSSFQLEGGDRVSVRLLRGVNSNVSVQVEGEVNYPGDYSAGLKRERISDFIEKAGGLSEYAFLEGATLVRKNPFYKEKVQKIITNDINGASVEDVNLNTKDINLNNREEFRVAIDLESILKNPANFKDNIIVKDGDRIVIPSVKSTIKTEGELFVPSLILYTNNNNFKDYISKSGGFGADAIRRKSYVIYPNGDIETTKRFMFFKSYPKVLPGSIIVVPKKIKTVGNNISTQEILGLTSGFATVALLVDRLLSN